MVAPSSRRTSKRFEDKAGSASTTSVHGLLDMVERPGILCAIFVFFSTFAARRTQSTRFQRPPKAGFTPLQVVVGLAGLALVLSILFPIFGRRPDGHGRRSCPSNIKQIFLGLKQYIQDYDEGFPVGAPRKAGKIGGIYAGVGWANNIYPYLKSQQLFQCKDDKTQPAANRFSYALNSNLYGGKQPSRESELKNPDRTILLAEVAGIGTDVTMPFDPTTGEGDGYSPVGNGQWGGSLYPTSPRGDQGKRMTPLWDTGPMANMPPGINQMQMEALPLMHGQLDKLEYTPQITGLGRHEIREKFGALYGFADGHVKSLPGLEVSNGANAKSAHDPQDGDFGRAEGTLCPEHAATFSTR